MRFREFVREPEALFWTLVFPILLASALGVAFSNQAPEVMRVAAVTPEIATALGPERQLAVHELSADAAALALRTGKVVLVVQPAPAGGVIYRYDDTNPEGRNARMLADRAIQIAAGRADPVVVTNDVAREV